VQHAHHLKLAKLSRKVPQFLPHLAHSLVALGFPRCLYIVGVAGGSYYRQMWTV